MNWIGLQTLVMREVQRFWRTANQSLVSPWISAALYIYIFGHVVGQRIEFMAGASYIDFVLPGIVMMNIISSAFMQTSFSLFLYKFQGSIQEILVTPLSYLEMILGFLIGGLARGLLVGLGVYAMAIFFSTATISHFWLFLFYSVAVAVIFSLLGLIMGIFSEHFEHLSMVSTFIIMPLTFLGGVFNSIAMLPPAVQTFVRFNPFFYFVDGLRFAMIGVREASIGIGLAIIFGLIVICGALTWYLFKIGYKMRT